MEARFPSLKLTLRLRTLSKHYVVSFQMSSVALIACWTTAPNDTLRNTRETCLHVQPSGTPVGCTNYARPTRSLDDEH